MKHKHYDCIVAWADGAKIEVYSDEIWIEVTAPNWNVFNEYRIKKEPVIEIKYYLKSSISYIEINPNIGTQWSLKITYQDGKAIKAELPDEN